VIFEVIFCTCPFVFKTPSDAARFGAAAAAALAFPASATDAAPMPLTDLCARVAASDEGPPSYPSDSSGAAAGAHLPSRLLPVDWSLRWIDRHVQASCALT